MTKKTHTSARGRVINFDSLQEQQDRTIAVGNAKLNARGDRIGSGGQVIQTAESLNTAQTQPQPQNTPTKKVSIRDNLDTLKSARSNWVTPNQSGDTDAGEAIDIMQAADMIDGGSRSKPADKKADAKKSEPKAKRTISDDSE